ncbi:hypothetical protein [Maribacter sp. ACAM166]|uniref:hypothetical protein n=1 Tax=Maribacter sp. ACAM166 TaxID=2508996 RepID=UPI0010FD23F7|nr:hypothetical protein [Maribacter sp. ACAM166]TLP81341.1 hypothetical protein ES765_04865 [Maribacter sp. ACAM166]
MYESIYNIDFQRLVATLLPIRRRTILMVQWLIALVEPINQLHTQFLRYRQATNYKLDHTAQVFSLEDVLNDAFDVSARRIYIEDGIYIFPVWFYDRADNKPVRFYNRAADDKVRFYDHKALGKLDVDFTVVLPNGLNISDAAMLRLKALVDFYRLPDKTYTVTYG